MGNGWVRDGRSPSSELAGTDYAAYDRVFTDSNGEFEVFPLGDARCSNRSSQNGQVFDTGYGTCIAQDGNGTERFNLWGLLTRDPIYKERMSLSTLTMILVTG